MSERVPLTRPLLDDGAAAAVAEVLKSGMLVQGTRVAALESAIADKVGVEHGVAVSTGTTAIHLALVALGIGPGDEVIVPDFCFPSVASAVIYTGAVPVLVDVDPDSFNLDLARIEPALSGKTRAVLAVHQFGIPCQAGELQRALDCAVVEDAACALGAIDSAGPCGSQTVMGCFSFHPRKCLTTAEGGMVTTDDDTLADRLRALRNHGMAAQDGAIVFRELGYPARMSDVHAAVGVSQLGNLDGSLAGRRRSALAYRELFSGLDGVVAPEPLWAEGRVFQGLVVRLAPHIDRDATLGRLRARGVDCTIGTYAIHRQSQLAKHCRQSPGGLTGSVLCADSSITLPLWPDMPGATIERVVESLRGVIT